MRAFSISLGKVIVFGLVLGILSALLLTGLWLVADQGGWWWAAGAPMVVLAFAITAGLGVAMGDP